MYQRNYGLSQERSAIYPQRCVNKQNNLHRSAPLWTTCAKFPYSFFVDEISGHLEERSELRPHSTHKLHRSAPYWRNGGEFQKLFPDLRYSSMRTYTLYCYFASGVKKIRRSEMPKTFTYNLRDVLVQKR